MFPQLVSHSCGSQEQSCATVPALTGSRAWEAPPGLGLAMECPAVGAWVGFLRFQPRCSIQGGDCCLPQVNSVCTLDHFHVLSSAPCARLWCHRSHILARPAV